MTASVRLATPDDLDRLWQLETTCFSDDDDRFSRRQLRYLLTRAKAITLVCGDETLWGYATLLIRRASGFGRIYSLCVAPDARGQGGGEALLEALEAQAQSLGLDQLRLEVRVDNDRALRLYQRRGYDRTAWLDDYYSDGCAGWKMIKWLTPTAPAPQPETQEPGR
ncbi:GNAT family N-acetyltransferase [Larsenimonas rhizosphaerae]|uniref:N-acetyltransferase n=1 Tax=Larsenimonas rhizosphaerae TaxID=2944682 RepID=A0AA41ZDA5_9GAMM|nr:N-acetyltransferase [Larsenimonas rhizosphaerae]MCM2130512.1 GNAT family N-acetyltransferase [Larsenimonas rhizosphaerae]MCX2523217.1 N-acetyltransferase [Larsenimonas rhizosphaerae]